MIGSESQNIRDLAFNNFAKAGIRDNVSQV